MRKLKLKDFDFQLPESLIAQKPLATRDQSKLMVVNRKSGTIKHEIFTRLPHFIPPQSLLVFNDTKVIPSKLNGFFVKSARPVEILLVRETGNENHWEALIKGLSKIKLETEMEFGNGELKAILKGRRGDKAILKLLYSGELQSMLNRIAKMPLPPYIRRKIEDINSSDQDRKRYQTIFARHAGAIAAPTAGLHFTPRILESLNTKGINTAYLTLHVGIGTFQPIRTENIIEHKMQAEKFHIPKNSSETLIEAKKNLRSVVAVGSTTTRVLESVEFTTLQPEGTSGWTDRFIYPGQKFKTVDHMLTNFHLPKSTLYLLVCAFAKKELIEEAYKKAIQKKYRFFSYGDVMLII